MTRVHVGSAAVADLATGHLGVMGPRAVAPLPAVASRLLICRSMTRRSPTSPGITRRRRSASPTRRAAGGKLFTKLGFSFFRLVSINDRDPGEPPYAMIRMRVARAAMATLAAASPANANAI